MKGYCIPHDVRLALAPLSEFSEKSTAASLTDEQINDAIDEAEDIVDSYVLGRYTIPIIDFEQDDPDNPGFVLVYNVAPDPVRGLTRNIAAYLATLTFRKNKDLPEDDPIRLRYRMTMEILGSIRGSVSILPDVFEPVTSGSDAVYVENLYQGTLFGMEDVGLSPGYVAGRTAATHLIPAYLWRV